MAPWSDRYYHAAVSHNGSIFVFGGAHPDNTLHEYYGDLWRSDDDGLNWTRIFEEGPMGPRSRSRLFSFKGDLWIVGGDFWKSSDNGLTWDLVNEDPWSGTGLQRPFSNRRLVVHKNEFYATIGSNNPYSLKPFQVWRSSDGLTWVSDDMIVPYISDISGMEVAYADLISSRGSLYFVGGSYFGGVTADSGIWRSDDDGLTWARICDSTPEYPGNAYPGGWPHYYAKRLNGRAGVWKNNIYVFGGNLRDTVYYGNDVIKVDTRKHHDLKINTISGVGDHHPLTRTDTFADCIHNGQFYIFGGRVQTVYGSSGFDNYAPFNDMWALPLPNDHRRRSAWVAGAGARFSGAISGVIGR